MEKILWANNAESTASGGTSIGGTLSLGGTTLVLAAGTGSRFPAPAAGECFLLTIYEKTLSAEEENHEIVKVTNRTADTLTIVRNQEGATYGYPTVDSRTVYVALRMTALGAGSFIQTGAVENGTGKTTPVDADLLPLVDSADSYALKKLTWANLKATAKTYFDTLYQAAGSYLTAASVDTLTNKSISLTSNTVTGTKAEFSTACSDGNFLYVGDVTADVTTSGANAFTGANTFTNSTGQIFRQAATQDGVLLRGRAGGTGSYTVEYVPTTLTASRTVTSPDANTVLPVATQTITWSGPTAARTYTLPDSSSTLAALGTAQSWTADQTFKETTDTVHTISDGAAFEIDPANGNIQVVTLGASRTPAATNFANGQCVLLGIDDGSAYTITWSTVNPTWVSATGSATAPTLATTGYTWILLWRVGSVTYGTLVGKP